MIHSEDLTILDKSKPNNELQSTWSKNQGKQWKTDNQNYVFNIPLSVIDKLGGINDVNNINKLYIINIYKSITTKNITFSNANEHLTKQTIYHTMKIAMNFNRPKVDKLNFTKMQWEIQNSHSYLNKTAGQLWNNGFHTKNQKYYIFRGAKMETPWNTQALGGLLKK